MDTNKQWLDLYEELYNKVIKLQNMEKKNIDDQSDKIDILINNIKSLKSELIEQLKNQELEVDETLSVRELIKKIEDIEGGSGSGECPDYNSFFEKVNEANEYEIIIRNYGGSGMVGDFPPLTGLRQIEEGAFQDAKFTGEFPFIRGLRSIYDNAFENSQFTGKFPQMEYLLFIGDRAFYYSRFTGEFPPMESLNTIGEYAFGNSNFDRDEDGFVVNYPGWDGGSPWLKPSSYRAAMKDVDIPKLMSIIPPGAGEIQVLNEEAKLAQSIRRDEYLEENEPSDIDYYISYTEKLKEIGFERDEYGNYVDVVNDKSVIIIPEDIKFLV